MSNQTPFKYVSPLHPNFSALREVRLSQKATIDHLVNIAKLDPGKNFRYTDLRSMDWRETNIERYDFTGCKLPLFFLKNTVDGKKTDTTTFRNAIAKAQTFDQGYSVLQEMVSTNNKIEKVDCNSVLGKAESLYEGLFLLDLMMDNNIAPTVHTVTQLIKISPNYGKAKSLFSELIARFSLEPDNIILNALISKATVFEEAVADFSLFEKYRIQPDNFTVNTLLLRAEKSSDYKFVDGVARKFQISPDLVFYRIRVNKAQNFQKACEILEEMKTTEINPDTRFLNELLEKANNSEQAQQALKLVNGGVLHDIFTKNILLKYAPTFESAQEILYSVFAEGLTPDSYTYNTMLKCAQTREEAVAVIDQMIHQKIAPDSYTDSALRRILNRREMQQLYRRLGHDADKEIDASFLFYNLLSTAGSAKEMSLLIKQMDEVGQSIQVRHVNEVAKRFLSLSQLLRFLSMHRIPLEFVTAGIVATVISNATSFSDARESIGMMHQLKITPSTAPYVELLRKCDDFTVGKQVLVEMYDFGVVPDAFIATELIRLIDDLDNASFLVRQLSEYGLVGLGFFSKVVYRLARLVAADELLNWAFTRGIKFPTKALASAISSYHESNKLEDALRIAVPFPHFDESLEVFRNYPDLSESYIAERFAADIEPHHASYALMKLKISQGDEVSARSWAEVAIKFEEQPSARINDIKDVLSHV